MACQGFITGDAGDAREYSGAIGVVLRAFLAKGVFPVKFS